MGKKTSTVAALQSLRLEAARWQAILTTARDAIIGIDSSGCVTLFNEAAERIFGYGADEVIGENVKILMPPPYRAEHDEYLRHYRETGVAKAIGHIRQVQGRRKSGETFPMELSVSEARVEDEVIYTAIVRDVSERVRADLERTELLRLVHQKERLADIGAITAKVVHDVGNPLAAMSMQIQLLLRKAHGLGAEAFEEVEKPAERVRETIRRLERLIHSFTSFAREQRLELSEVEVPEFIQEIVRWWEPLAAEREVALRVERARKVPPIRADAEKLRRVMENLLKNALEALEEGPGEVRIGMDRPIPETVRISIADTGPGLPESLDVFGLFESTKAQGVGLGLAIAREIVLAHGGRIEFARRAPRGTIFRVELPVHGPAL